LSLITRSVNSIKKAAYGLIGRRIVEFEEKGLVRAEFCARLLKCLSTREDFRNSVSEISVSGDISDTVCESGRRNFRPLYPAVPVLEEEVSVEGALAAAAPAVSEMGGSSGVKCQHMVYDLCQDILYTFLGSSPWIRGDGRHGALEPQRGARK